MAPSALPVPVLGALWDRHWLLEAAAAEAYTDIPSTEWRAGGRASKDWPNRENENWWSVNGPQMLQAFVDWWEANNNWHIWVTPDGEAAVELDLSGEINGTQ